MSDLTHVGGDGAARMVDVSGKGETERFARASGCVRMEAMTLEAIRANSLGKGDVLAVARIAGVMAAKRTAELVPLCHPVALTDVQITLSFDDLLPGVRAEAAVRSVGRTGVEMEAITAVSVTLITIYDMVKGVDRRVTISEILLVEKGGGRSGHWTRR